MRPLFTVAALTAFAALTAPAWAGPDDLIRVKAAGDVTATMDALVQAVEGAGVTVFARIDHAEGAKGAGMDLVPEQVLIFGKPEHGTQAMQADPLAGLLLPMKVLVYEDAEGQTWLVYEDVAEMFEDYDIPQDAEYVQSMTKGLKNLTTKAAGG
ncbi:MAG TPA: DUF302 domain-containing protein [Roseovarius sp.]